MFLKIMQIGYTTVAQHFESVSNEKPGRRWYSSNHRFRLNLAQNLGLMGDDYGKISW